MEDEQFLREQEQMKIKVWLFTFLLFLEYLILYLLAGEGLINAIFASVSMALSIAIFGAKLHDKI